MIKLNRRRIISALGLATIGAGALAIRPGKTGAPHTDYFSGIAAALKQAGIATPTLVIDRRQLQANVRQIMRNIAGRMRLRIVVKSLPSPALLDEVMQITKSQSLMAFSLPHLMQMARGPVDILLGKPMPVAAAAQFYKQHRNAEFVAERQLRWLIDTPERLTQYRQLAREQRLNLLVNFEIDVGLHRGGIGNLQALQDMLAIVRSEPRLHWSGLMGYDAHITKIPNIGSLQQVAREHARQLYASYAAETQRKLGPTISGGKPCYNAGGSPTYRLYDGSGIENELSIGSAMVKPHDFDTDLLADLRPAVFIATPVLKAQAHFMMPYGVEWIGDAAGTWDVNQRKAYFIYGGNWLADPVSPAGLAASGLYGTSSNQQVLLGSGAQQLRADDIVFFRPRQSEAVLQQFGDIAVYEDGKITQQWAPMQATA